MSNYTLNSSQNLTDIFQPIGSRTPVPETGYKSNGSDLNTIFAGFISGNYATSTGYIVKNYSGNSGLDTDLSNIFQSDPIAPYITTGTVTTTSDGSYNRILTWTSSGTITFNQSTIGTAPSANVTGGGAGGWHGGDGNGGGGAQPNNILNMSSPVLNTTYSITVGTGGNGGSYNNITLFQNPTSGSSSIFAYTSTYTGAGGTIYGGGARGQTDTNGGAGVSINSGGGGGGGSTTSSQYVGGAGNGNGGKGGNGGFVGGRGRIGENGKTPGGGGGGGGINGIGYSPTPMTYAAGGDGAQGSVIFKFNI